MGKVFTSQAILSPVLSPYVGPGDVVSGAAAWWGLRAYSAASIGVNAVRLRKDDVGNTEQDFATIAGGGLDLAAIATFQGANSLFVVTLYDQTGHSLDQVQATAGNQPAFTLSGLGGLPVLTFDGTSDKLSTAGSDTFVVTSTTESVVANHINNAAQQVILSAAGVFQLGYHLGGTPNTAFIYGGHGIPTATASDATWHAIQGVYANPVTAADVNVDGVVTTGDIGALATGGTGTIEFGSVSGGQLFKGTAVEAGMWKAEFTTGNRTAMSANQHAYWGF